MAKYNASDKVCLGHVVLTDRRFCHQETSSSRFDNMLYWINAEKKGGAREVILTFFFVRIHFLFDIDTDLFNVKGLFYWIELTLYISTL